MFYSPKKNIEAFIESKNQEIKALKQKILGSKITYEQMEDAKARLNSLRTSQLQLERQDHLELKEVVKASQQAVSDLVKRKNRLLSELEGHQKENHQMGELECELASKKQKAEQFHKQVLAVKGKLLDRKEKKNIQISELQEETTLRKKEIKAQKDIGEQLEAAKAELKIKSTKMSQDLESVSQQNKKLRECVKKELQQIAKLEHQQESDDLRVENLQLKIEKEEKHALNLQQKIDAAQVFMQRFAEDRLVHLKQTETAQNIESLLRMCTDSNQKKQKEQRECQEQIRQLQKKIEAATVAKKSAFAQATEKQDILKQLKEKGAELKNILNSIFHQDSSVLKLLADKKVYDSDETTKKAKEAQQVYVKQDMLEMLATSDNFFMTTGH